MEKPSWVDDVTWARFNQKFDPATIHSNLLQAGLFLTAFELLKNAVISAPFAIEPPRIIDGQLVRTTFEKGRLKPTAYYLDKVREFNMLGETNVNPSDFYLRGAMWLAKDKALTAEEVEELRALRDYRNDVAHELAVFLVDINRTLDIARYVRLVELFRKVALWHGRLAVDCDEDFDGQAIDDRDIQSVSVLVVDMLNDLVFDLHQRPTT